MRNDIKLLLAEDDRGHYVLTKHCLKKACVENELLWFTDGEKTMNFLFARSKEPAIDHNNLYILLLDIRMPKVDGITILEKIKQDDQLKDIPVIIVTTSNSPANIGKCSRLGCIDYVVKPLGENLIDAIEKASNTFQICPA
ncbi:MAG: response regulator [Planctomycetes bacterium]|nr:response regulator [Planctomycetota bacterium]